MGAASDCRFGDTVVLLLEWADRMDHVTGGQVIAPGDPRLARRAAADLAAFVQQPRPRRPVNGPVHTAPAKKRFVRGVHDGVHLQRGDVGGDDLDRHGVTS